jgi:hypothetical protein
MPDHAIEAADQIVEAADLVIAFPGKGRVSWNTIYLAWKK